MLVIGNGGFDGADSISRSKSSVWKFRACKKPLWEKIWPFHFRIYLFPQNCIKGSWFHCFLSISLPFFTLSLGWSILKLSSCWPGIFSLILKLRKKAKGRTMQGVLSYKENFGLKVPIVNNILVSVFFFGLFALNTFYLRKTTACDLFSQLIC